MASQRPKDIDLMLYADRELSGEEARGVEARLEEDARARDVVAGVREVGEVVRSHLARETEEAAERSPGFARMWDEIERRVHANGASRGAAAAAGAGEAVPGLWARLRRWFEEHRGHMVTGLAAAGATAAILLAVLPLERTVVREKTVQAPAPPVEVAPAALESQPPEVENLEVYDGEGMILTIPGEDENDSGTAVIWITPEEDTLEDPI